MEPVSTRSIKDIPDSNITERGSQSSSPKPPRAPTYAEAKKARDAAKPTSVGGGIFRASGKHTIFESKKSTPEEKVSNESQPPIPTPSPVQKTVAQPVNLPSSLFEFNRAWYNTKVTAIRFSMIAVSDAISVETRI